MLSRAALAAIYVYQHKISPYKGYRCAYSVLHGGTGCSGYAKAALQKHGAFAALPLIRDRLRQCTLAKTILRAQPTAKETGDETGETKTKSTKPACMDRCAAGIDCCNVVSLCRRADPEAPNSACGCDVTSFT